jgi:DeoR/GlpR family transcriptional regulator of sugar metabolism
MGSGQTEGRTIAHVRRQEIADALRAEGSVTVARLEERFGISSMTARRDLAELERRGLARRTHGGAVLPTAAGHEDSFFSRLTRAGDAKLALARAAAELVAEEDSVFLDSSSTAYHVARELLERNMRLTVITNSQPIMELVAAHPTTTADLIGIGGTLRRLTRSFVGPVATQAVQSHYADRFFFSVKGVTPDGVLTDADSLEAEVKRTMLRHATDPVLLIDQSKLESRGLSVIAPVAEVSRILTCGVEEDELAPLAALGVALHTVPNTEEAA